MKFAYVKLLTLLLFGFFALGISGCDAFSQASSVVKTTSSPIILREQFLAGTQLFPQVIELNKVQQWLYDSSQKISFKSLNPPYVVNAAIRNKTSQIVTELNVRVYRADNPLQMSDMPIETRNIAGMGGRQAFIIIQKGDYVIDVASVGCQWWVMVGNETEAYRQ